MTDEPISYDLVYVHTDIPAGMTIREWRAQGAADRGAARRSARAAWRRSTLVRRLRAALPSWLLTLRQTLGLPAREIRA